VWRASTRVATRGSTAKLTARGTSTTSIPTTRGSAREVTVLGASAWVATRGSTTELTVRDTPTSATTARGSTTELTVRGTSTSATTARGSTTELTMRGAAAGAAARMSALADVVTCYRMRVRTPTTGRAVTLATGSTTASTVRATLILGPTSALPTVMRYIVSGASTRTTSTRGNHSPSRELARSRSRSHRRPAVIERRMQLSVSESRMLVITL
jgi:hypothetical protein